MNQPLPDSQKPKGISAPLKIMYVLWWVFGVFTWPAIVIYWGVSQDVNIIWIFLGVMSALSLTTYGTGMLIQTSVTATKKFGVWNPLRYLAILAAILSPILSVPAGTVFLFKNIFRRRY